MSQKTLTKGEVRYLGHRPDLDANLYAVKSGDGMPPEPLGRLIAAAPALVAALTTCEEYLATLTVPEYPETHDEDLSRCCSPEEPNDCLLCETRAALKLAKADDTDELARALLRAVEGK